MDIHIKTVIILILSLMFGVTIQAQEDKLKLVKMEIERLTEAEIEAFKQGDCDTAVEYMDDNITFYGNGRKIPSKDIIKKFCFGLNRPFEKPESIDTQINPLTERSAYVVRVMEFKKADKIYKKEIVTKVWKKGKYGWKIMHLHSTIKILSPN